MKEVRINRHGMTQCHECGQWIRVEGELDQTSCPFCGHHVTEGRSLPADIAAAIRAAVTSKRNLALAVASLAMTVTVSCGEVAQPAYGAPPPEEDMSEEVDMEEDNDMADEADMGEDANNVVMPLYGNAPATEGD